MRRKEKSERGDEHHLVVVAVGRLSAALHRQQAGRKDEVVEFGQLVIKRRCECFDVGDQ